MNITDMLKVYFVMGSHQCYADPIEVVRDAIRGGITCFQYREKGSGALVGSERVELGWHLRQVCLEHGVPFIVNDDVDLAIELHADGVHIGQEDGNVPQVRARIGAQKILGVSTHNVEEAKQAIQEGADYIGVGPMYRTSTKKDTEHVRGPIVIREIREVAPLFPLVGIGGISSHNAYDVISSGAHGVAVISAISQAKCPFSAVEELVAEVKHGLLLGER